MPADAEIPLTYAVVLVTRNRPAAVSLSLPIILGQTRPPAQVIVVDSSDDPAATRAAVQAAADGSGRPVEVLPSAPGTSLQRNLGLARVEHPVVLFPDDDSLLEPGTMAEVMAIYERDREGVVGGVCTAEALEAPAGLAPRRAAAYRMTAADRLRKLAAPLRYHLERNVLADPFLSVGRRCLKRLAAPAWLAERNAVPVEWMTGFRMSFRTEAIRRVGFDEALGTYALFEDTDASLRVLGSKLLVGARNTAIYHYKSPERRDDGYTLGLVQSLNRAYVLARSGEMDRAIRARYVIFSLYKIAQYGTAVHDRFGRDRLRGAVRGLVLGLALVRTPPEALADTYRTMRARAGLATPAGGATRAAPAAPGVLKPAAATAA